MIGRIEQGFFEGHPDLQPFALGEDPHVDDQSLEVGDHRGQHRRIILEDELRPQRVHPADQRSPHPLFARQSQYSLNGLDQIGTEQPLRDVTGSSAFQGLDSDVFAPLACHQDDGNQRMLGLHVPNKLQPVHLGHLQVGYDRIYQIRPEPPRGLFAAAGIMHQPTVLLREQSSRQTAVHRGVIDDEDRNHRLLLSSGCECRELGEVQANGVVSHRIEPAA